MLKYKGCTIRRDSESKQITVDGYTGFSTVSDALQFIGQKVRPLTIADIRLLYGDVRDALNKAGERELSRKVAEIVIVKLEPMVETGGDDNETL